jgi:hypothetical protein
MPGSAAVVRLAAPPFDRETHTTVALTFAGETIITTPNHPFRVIGRGWVEAGDLAVGDELQLLSGGSVTLEQAVATQLASPLTVYNFEVEGWHSYHVGSNAVLVHNAECGDDRVFNSSKQDSPIWNSFKNVKGRNLKTTGSGSNKRYYEWDYTHNDIEVYNHQGIHLGSMDPRWGQMYKEAVPGRRINI